MSATVYLSVLSRYCNSPGIAPGSGAGEGAVRSCASSHQCILLAVYEEFIRQNLVQADLAMAMKSYNEAVTADAKSSAREEFMRLNVELYGEPDKETYYSMLSEKMVNISSKECSPEAQVIYLKLLSGKNLAKLLRTGGFFIRTQRL